MKGAVIASDATPDKNKLSTGTLTFSDIQNNAEYSASSSGVNYNAGKGVATKDLGLTPNIGVKVSGDASSTTQSGIANGTIEIRDGNTDLSKLNRDTDNSLHALDKIFDKKTVQEKQELAKVFGEVAFKAIGDLADREKKKATTPEEKAKWEDGGEYKVALHALVGGIMSDIGGGGFTSGAVGAGVSEAAQGELSKITDPALRQWASAVVGAAAAKVTGGNAQTGASTAASGTKNNDYNHRTHREGEIVHTKDGFFQVINGVDTAIAPPPEGVYFWEQDGNNPDYGWDYKKGNGVDTVDTYFSGVVKDQYYFDWNGTAYGVAITDQTDAQKHEILVGAGKAWADAQLAALSGGGMFGGVGQALKVATTARVTMTEQILSIPKGARPDPATYLPQSYIDSHLASFESGVTKFYADAPTGVAGPPGGTFVMPKAVADDLIAKLEKSLGLEPGTLGSSPVRVDVSSPSGLRMPSGNEKGANPQWIPGGYTSGGIPEATINAPSPSEYTVTSIF